jgi:tetratricopeptide (TPR) repeat protein
LKPRICVLSFLLLLISTYSLFSLSESEISSQLNEIDINMSLNQWKEADQRLTALANQVFNNQSGSIKDQSEILWRQSRLHFHQSENPSINSKQKESLHNIALDLAQKSILTDQNNINALKWSWKLHMRLGSLENGISCSSWYQKARSLLFQALSLDDSDAELWFFAGLLYVRTPEYLFGNKQYAISLTRKSVTIDHPKNGRHLLLLADLLLLRQFNSEQRQLKLKKDRDLFVFTTSTIKKNFYFEGACIQEETPYLNETIDCSKLSDFDEAKIIVDYIVANINAAPEKLPTNEQKEYLKQIAIVLERIQNQNNGENY